MDLPGFRPVVAENGIGALRRMNVFICHAPSDNRTASKLALDLMKRAVNVWVDQPNPQGDPLEPAVRWQEISSGISRADAFVVLLSPTAVTSPDLLQQLDFALAQERRILCAMRQETLLTTALARKLAGAPQCDVSRAHYDAGLVELLGLLGLPDQIVNEIVSPLEVEEWLPGTWDVQFYNATNGVNGTATFGFEADRSAEGHVTVYQGTVRIDLNVRGNWQFMGDNFIVQGFSRLSMSIEEAILPQAMTYLLALKVVDLQPGVFHAESAVGDRVIFRKTMR
jgi:hypothetical protein